MNLNNNTSTGKLLNGKIADYGVKAIDEVETIAADMLKQVKIQVSEFTTRSLSMIRKNPVLAVAVAVTVGLVIAKMIRKPDGSESTTAHH